MADLLASICADVLVRGEWLHEADGEEEQDETGHYGRLLQLDSQDPAWVTAFVEHLVARATGDDLLFFVRLQHASDGEAEKDAVFVRRNDHRSLPALDDVVAWKESVLLNAIVQTPFRLTVSVCERSSSAATSNNSLSALSLPSNGVRPLVAKEVRAHNVYASPHRIRMDIKSDVCELSYPVVYFALNDFDEGFTGGLVVRPSQYLCVELTVDILLPDDIINNKNNNNNSQENTLNALPLQPTTVTLFQGAVPFHSLDSAHASKASPSAISSFFNSFFPAATINSRPVTAPAPSHSSSSSDTAIVEVEDDPNFIMMRGPGGKGFAQVAVRRRHKRTLKQKHVSPPSASTSTSLPKPSFLSSLKQFSQQLTAPSVVTPSSSFPPPSSGQPVTQDRTKVVEERVEDGLDCRMTFVNLDWTTIISDVLTTMDTSRTRRRPSE